MIGRFGARRAAAALGVTGLLAVAGPLLAACGSDDSSSATTAAAATASVPPATAVPTQLDATTSKALLDSDTKPVVLDVRTPDEFGAAHIAGAKDLDWNGGVFANQIGSYDKNATYFVYCHSGNRSGQATAMMKQLGFTHVYELQGGMNSWLAAGMPVTTA